MKPTSSNGSDPSTRENALQLLAWTQHQPRAPRVDQLATELFARRRNGHWSTTQGNAWSLLALTSYLRNVETGPRESAGTIAWAQATKPFTLSEAAPLATSRFPDRSRGDARARHDQEDRRAGFLRSHCFRATEIARATAARSGLRAGAPLREDRRRRPLVARRRSSGRRSRSGYAGRRSSTPRDLCRAWKIHSRACSRRSIPRSNRRKCWPANRWATTGSAIITSCAKIARSSSSIS